MGQSVKASEYYKRAVAIEHRPNSELAYHQALAFRELGKTDQAEEILDSLAESGNRWLDGNHGEDFFAKFGKRLSEYQRVAEAHYLVGLSLLGHGKAAAAAEEFRQALDMDVNHLGAAIRLGKI